MSKSVNGFASCVPASRTLMVRDSSASTWLQKDLYALALFRKRPANPILS